MLTRLHLVRHGEVHNPSGVVYAGLPGFPLSVRGRLQAAQAAEHLAGDGVSLLVTSPLDRARETAGYLERRLGLVAVVEPALTEWGLSDRWAGEPWDRLDDRFPGELAAYADDPSRLPFSPESLQAVAQRTGAAVAHLGEVHPGAVAAVVSHQDPIQALRRYLLGTGFTGFHDDKPAHAAVITLQWTGNRWQEIQAWAPALPGAPFPPPVAARNDDRR